MAEEVLDVVRGIFGLHGAVAMQSSALGLVADAAALPKGAVGLLDASGALLALRYELRGPFCDWLALQAAKGRLPSSLLFPPSYCQSLDT